MCSSDLRLYCGEKTGQERRSSQTAIYHITDTLIRLIAPILVFTAEDAYSFFNKPNKLESIHLEAFPSLPDSFKNIELESKWETLLNIREQVYQKLEQLRNEKTVKSFLEAKVDLTLSSPINFEDWPSFLIVSEDNINDGDKDLISVEKADGEKCERCWKVFSLTKNLCSRCDSVVETFQ